MKSAYLVLGVPGNATKEDFEAAFQKAKDFYSPARLAADPQALEKFLEVKTAYQVLRDEESRAAHDRKLSSAQASMAPRARVTRPVTVQEEASWPARAMPILLAVAVVVFAAIFYVSTKRETARKELAAQELQLKAKVAEEAKKKSFALPPKKQTSCGSHGRPNSKSGNSARTVIAQSTVCAPRKCSAITRKRREPPQSSVKTSARNTRKNHGSSV